MDKKIKNELKEQVQSYNALNKEKKELEDKLAGITKEMLKILGKIELLNDLNKNDWFFKNSCSKCHRNKRNMDWMVACCCKSCCWDCIFYLYLLKNI